MMISSININGKKRLHFFLDEKVVNDTIDIFEAFSPNENIYIILSKDGKALHINKHNNTYVLLYKSSELKLLLDNICNFKEVICHSMWYDLAKIIKRTNHPNITWVIWGSDLYENMLYRKGYSLYFDEASLYKIRAQHLPVFLYMILVSIRDRIHYKALLKATSKSHNVVCCKEDYDLMINYYPEFKKFIRKDFFYYPIEKMLDNETKESFVNGKDVWVNNAAGYNGNHMEIFSRLAKLRWDGIIHVPLSYGFKNYAKYICEEGQKIFGNNIDPMMTFVPKHDYYKKFLDSNSFVFGHLRQCAFGNIIIALYLGAKVFLFKENPLYQFFMRMGLVVYNIEDDLNKENLISSLPEYIRHNNRKLILDNYSYEKLMNLLREYF